ncbi:tripartite tricarboxylate transporter substrate binding protein [Rhodobacter sp. NTK016B]|uniref:tripartite tricarboxylate transporter substrate binding protein n=1 Tax=Rhodobacter sp. NTK016B TaxID=2759676 RepID=UPI001A8D2DE4|nr:tripartite tricarboxylate transporter substrate binding protein [Rhodobacter sp. NTK016B]MBN8291832.1 tripartite tricarboxylate transporter substrate binding protein [Rhodobacter sp. NTK016B]
MPFFKTTTKTATALALGLSLVAGAAWAEYPERAVTAIVPFPAGGSTDTMGRAAAEVMSGILGTDIAVTNVGGGAGTVGTAQIARARADGYTIGVIPAAPLINQPHMRETPYGLEDFTYICGLFHSPQALALAPDSPFSSLAEVVDYARANPGQLTYGSPGPGSLPHLAMEQFLDEVGVEISHVPFQGDGPGVTALMGGHIDMYMAIFSNVPRYELNAVAIFADERVAAAPDVPTSIEEGFTTTASWWGGLFGPANMPEDVRATLEDACQQTAESPEFTEILGNLGSFPRFLSSEAVHEAVMQGSETNGAILERVLN